MQEKRIFRHDFRCARRLQSMQRADEELSPRLRALLLIECDAVSHKLKANLKHAAAVRSLLVMLQSFSCS